MACDLCGQKKISGAKGGQVRQCLYPPLHYRKHVQHYTKHVQHYRKYLQHYRSQVGMGSESHCLLGQLNKILEISDSTAGLKVEKSRCVFGEGE